MQRYGYAKPYIRSLVEGKYSDPDAIFTKVIERNLL